MDHAVDLSSVPLPPSPHGRLLCPSQSERLSASIIFTRMQRHMNKCRIVRIEGSHSRFDCTLSGPRPGNPSLSIPFLLPTRVDISGRPSLSLQESYLSPMDLSLYTRPRNYSSVPAPDICTTHPPTELLEPRTPLRSHARRLSSSNTTFLPQKRARTHGRRIQHRLRV